MNASPERYAQLAARLLKLEVAEESPPSTDGHRDAIVAALALAMAAKSRRRKVMWGAGAVAVAAAAAVALVVVGSGPGPTHSSRRALTVAHTYGAGNQLVRATEMLPLADQGSLLPGDIVRSGEDASATLAVVSGTRLTLSPVTELRVDELTATWRFSLARGQLHAHVAKLAGGERFVVDTPDSQIEVRGTEFRVVVGDRASTCMNAQTRSSVEVTEGTVAVRSGGNEVLLRPGQSWSAPCASPQTAPSEAARPASRLAQPTSRTARPVSRRPSPPLAMPPPPSPTESPVSRLAEQNDLLSAAMAAERRGQHDVALRQLESLLARFPDGPLSESARAERERILSARTAPR